MLARIYVEALLVDEELADQVWALWHSGRLDDSAARFAWWGIVARSLPWSA